MCSGEKDAFWNRITRSLKSFHVISGETISLYDYDKEIKACYIKHRHILDLYDSEGIKQFLSMIELPIAKKTGYVNVFKDYVFIVLGLYDDDTFMGIAVVGPILTSEREAYQSYVVGSTLKINTEKHDIIDYIDSTLHLFCSVFLKGCHFDELSVIYNRKQFKPFEMEQFFNDSIEYMNDEINAVVGMNYSEFLSQLVFSVLKYDKKAVKKMINGIFDIELPRPLKKLPKSMERLRVEKNIILLYFSVIQYILLENVICSDFNLHFMSVLVTEFEHCTNVNQLKLTANNLIDQLFDNMRVEENQANRQIRTCINYINNHMEHKLTLEEVAEQIHHSSKYLSRLFKQETGMAFKEYVAGQKLKVAKNLLRYTDIPVAQVGLSIGYNSLSNFTVFFKRLTRMSPNQYRQS